MDLGPSRAPAHLLLDDRPVCEVSERSPGCTVDLGPDPRVHLLELVRTDGGGRVTERVSRWINRPGIEPEVLVSGGCDEKTLVCDFGITWAHPGKLDPKKLVLQLDGVKRWERVGHEAKIAIAKGSKPQIVSCDVEFPDGSRAAYTRTLYAFNPEEAQASLVSIPVIPGPDAGSSDAIAARLKEAGLPVRTVEETEPEVTFVMDPTALDTIVGYPHRPSSPGSYLIRPRSAAEGSTDFNAFRVIFPAENLPTQEIPPGRLGTIGPTFSPRYTRYADAVAAAGYALGASPHRRAVVLILHGFDRPNISSFTAAQARAYLAEVMVPLVVWRVGDVAAPEWPEGPRFTTRDEFLVQLSALRASVASQRILWLEGFHDMRYAGRWLIPGVALAGRDSGAGSGRLETPPQTIEAATAPSLGPDGGPVHALAAAGDGSVVFAGTHGGVFRSRDRGEHWEATSAGLPIAPVRHLAVDPGRRQIVVAGTDAGLFTSADAGVRWQPARGDLAATPVASIAFDPGSAGGLFIGTTGRGVLRGDDAGETLLATSLGHGDVRGIAVDPKTHAVLAATEAGVFRSRDRGLTWTEAGHLPARALALAMDSSGVLFAATAGRGLWKSEDAGATWRSAGLDGAYLTSVALPGAGILLAGSPVGVFVSANGRAWGLAPVGAVETFAGAPGAPLAGSARGVLRRLETGWKESNSGLTASIVYSVAASSGPAAALYAATSAGLRRQSGADPGWKTVPGVPDGVVADSVMPMVPRNVDLCVGTTGSIGRSEDAGVTWSFVPTHAAFHFALDPSKPDFVLAAAREGVLKSEDGGRRWSLAASGMEKTFALQLGHDPAEPDTYYAATAGAGVYRTVNAARSWKAGGVELTRRIVRSVAADPTDRQVVYAGTDSGIFRSADRGEDWAPASEGLPPAPVYALVADPRSPSLLFAGTAEGLFRSSDGGTRWDAYPAEALRAAVIALWLDPGSQTLVAGTLGAGVFRIPLPDAKPAQ